jgi:hypothetical protein
MIRRPYYNPGLVTDKITYEEGYIKNYYSVNPGRAIEFIYEPMLFEEAPTTD